MLAPLAGTNADVGADAGAGAGAGVGAGVISSADKAIKGGASLSVAINDSSKGVI